MEVASAANTQVVRRLRSLQPNFVCVMVVAANAHFLVVLRFRADEHTSVLLMVEVQDVVLWTVLRLLLGESNIVSLTAAAKKFLVQRLEIRGKLFLFHSRN